MAGSRRGGGGAAMRGVGSAAAASARDARHRPAARSRRPSPLGARRKISRFRQSARGGRRRRRLRARALGHLRDARHLSRHRRRIGHPSPAFPGTPIKLPLLDVNCRWSRSSSSHRGSLWCFISICCCSSLCFRRRSRAITSFWTSFSGDAAKSEDAATCAGNCPTTSVQFPAGPRGKGEGEVRSMLMLVALATIVIGPLVVLMALQYRFLPYQDEWVTWVQRGAVFVDLALLWLLWPRVILGGGVGTSRLTATIFDRIVRRTSGEPHGARRFRFCSDFPARVDGWDPAGESVPSTDDVGATEKAAWRTAEPTL